MMRLWRAASAAMVTVLLFGVLGCHEDPEPFLGKYTLKGVERGLVHGYLDANVLELDDDNKPGRWYNIILTTDGVTVSDTKTEGSGDLLYVEVFSASVDELLAGSYSYYESNRVGVWRLTVFQNFTTAAGEAEKVWFGESGTLTLSKSEDHYELDFSGVAEDKDTGDKVPVSGTFSGTVVKIF